MATAAMSPFVRGWKLGEIGRDTAVVADTLLRWEAFQDAVDGVVVSMRRVAWLHANLRSPARGPLTSGEQARLADWLGSAR